MRYCLIICYCLFGFLEAFAGDTLQYLPMQVRSDTITLYGTLSLPPVNKPPVVLWITGSGHTNRDGNQPGMKNNTYLQIAEGLGKEGIAMLRYDKRGVGESKVSLAESDLRFDHYIQDALAWLRLLKKDSRFSGVIVAGHSEGSLIGMAASVQEAPKAYISIAGASEPIDKILRVQLAHAIPDSAYYALSCLYLDTLSRGDTLTNADPALSSLFRPGIQPYMINWMKYDPAKEIRKLQVPVAILQGATDIQVDLHHAFNLQEASPGSYIRIIPDMNHVLKKSEIDREKNLSTYGNPELPVVVELIQELSRFIQKNQ